MCDPQNMTSTLQLATQRSCSLTRAITRVHAQNDTTESLYHLCMKKELAINYILDSRFSSVWGISYILCAMHCLLLTLEVTFHRFLITTVFVFISAQLSAFDTSNSNY